MKMSSWLLLLFALMGVCLFVISLISLFSNGFSGWIFGMVVGVMMVMAAVEEAHKVEL